jgi:hypothetical protein
MKHALSVDMRRCLLRSPNVPLRLRDDMPAPPSHTSGRKAVLISSSFDPERDSLAMR